MYVKELHKRRSVVKNPHGTSNFYETNMRFTYHININIQGNVSLTLN